MPVYLEKTANIPMAINDILLSKTFDNGTICASEQSWWSTGRSPTRCWHALPRRAPYILNPDEVKRVEAIAIDERRGLMAAAVVGQPATKIAALAGVTVPPTPSS